MTQEVSSLIAQLDAEKTQLQNMLNDSNYKIQQILEVYPEIKPHIQKWLELIQQSSPNIDIPLKSIPKDEIKKETKTK